MKLLEFNNATVTAKANIYFDGKVVSHAIQLAEGSEKTLGLIYPGSYHFNTEKAEKMEIVGGHCVVSLDGQDPSREYQENEHFDVPASSGFTITVNSGICEYICSFIS